MTANLQLPEDTGEHEWPGIVLVLALLALSGVLVMLFT